MLVSVDCPVCGGVLPCVTVDAATRLDGDTLTVELSPRLDDQWCARARRIHPTCFGDVGTV